MKKQSTFTTNWQRVKTQVGTINSCLATFANIVDNDKELGNIYGKYLYGKSNKELNRLYYKDIKQFTKEGEIIQRVTTVKGCKTTYTYTKKCSVYDIYRFFHTLNKTKNI